MSSSTITLQTSNALFVNFDYDKVIIERGYFENAIMNNATGGELTYPAGTVLGRVSASSKVIPMASAAADGSQYPVGILTSTVTIGAGADLNISMAISGEMTESLIVLDGADTLTTIVDGRQIGDRIKSDNIGIKLTSATEMTVDDNS